MMMTKQKKAVSCLLCIILLLTGLYSAAAESSAQDDSPGGKVVIWKVVAPEFNTEALLDYKPAQHCLNVCNSVDTMEKNCSICAWVRLKIWTVVMPYAVNWDVAVYFVV